MIGQLFYFLRRALRNMRYSPVLTAASIFTVGVALALLAFFTIAVLNVQRLTATWAAELAVVVYLEQPPEGTVLTRWLNEIRAYPEVADVSYVSRQEAYQRFKRRLGSDADLLDGLGVDVLPAFGTKSGRWNTAGQNKPYAFIRNSRQLGNHQPTRVLGTTYTAQCSGTTSPCSNGMDFYSNGTTSPGGTY